MNIGINRHLRILVSLALVALLVANIRISVVHGATQSFNVQTLVGSDVTPPTIPGSLSVTPVSISQINLSWATSTDDGLVVGYHVWRDGVLLGTAPGTSYEDGGLIASTTYTYYVTALDFFGNESASSSEVSGTTLSPAPTSTPTSTPPLLPRILYGSKATPFEHMITEIQIFPGKESARIRYITSEHVRSVVKWGTSASYEQGSLVESLFSTSHEANLDGLTPGTRYNFTIEGENNIGKYGSLYSGTFITNSVDGIHMPSNVTGLSAIRSGNDVLLTWINPKEPTFSKVRILKNNHFFPSDSADGAVLYEGDSDAFRDVNVVRDTTPTIYYTVFVYDTEGNISSGAVVSVPLNQNGQEETPTEPQTHNNVLHISLDDITLVQEGIILEKKGDAFSIDGAKRLTISIPYERLPEHLKTIVVTLTDSRNDHRKFQFLLRVNAERTAYVGTIAPLGSEGVFPFTVTVFDFDTSEVGYTQGLFDSSIRPISTEGISTVGVGLLEALSQSKVFYLAWFTGALILMIILLIRRMRREA